MAASPGHKFGQMIGNLLEEIVEPVLLKVCNERGLYLDKKGPRAGIRKGKKVSWRDTHGNSHDLDFVIERVTRNGRIGRPRAFIEVAWRRYTKHSRNKAQEIQGAILPIYEKYSKDKPFLGVVLAGDFTKPSLRQMRSLGFTVLHFPYPTVKAAYRAVGVDAAFDEKTSDAKIKRMIRQVESLNDQQREKVIRKLKSANRKRIDVFLRRIKRSLDRKVKKITVVTLRGDGRSFSSINGAARYAAEYAQNTRAGRFLRYDVLAEFTNGDRIQGEFADKEKALRFLEYIST